MHKDIYVYVKNCPECTVVCGGGKVQRPSLCPIPVIRPFQILMDIMALPKTPKGNQHVLVFQVSGPVYSDAPMIGSTIGNRFIGLKVIISVSAFL